MPSTEVLGLRPSRPQAADAVALNDGDAVRDLLGDAATLTGGSDRAAEATVRDGTLAAAVDGEDVTFALDPE